MVWQVRNRLVAAATALVLGASVAACGGATSGEGGAGSDGSSDAGSSTISIGLDGLPEMLAPSSTTAAATHVLSNQVFDPLVRLDPDSGNGVVPALAESWEISDDGTTYTFQLREDVTFHDGEPFDAQAVALNYERLADPDSPYYWPVGGEVATAQVLNVVDSIEVVDDMTVNMHLVEPYPDFPDNLARPYFMFISPDSIKNLSPDEASQAAVGTGPFKLAEREGDSLIRLEAFADYYEGPPPTDEILVRPYASASALVAALESGEVDMTTAASYDEIDRLEGEFEAWGWGTESTYLIAFNTDHPLTSDRRVRQALNYAVDKDGIVNGLFNGGVSEAVGPYSPSNAAFDPDTGVPYPHDPAQARSLLDEAGAGEGEAVKAIIPSDVGIPLIPEMAQTIQAGWKDIGVDVEFDTVEWNAYLDIVGEGIPDEYVFYVTQWGATYPGWLELLHGEASLPPDGPNRGYYVNNQVEDLFDRARSEPDPEARIDLYRQAEDLIVQDAPWLYTIYSRNTGLKIPSVQGIRQEMVSFDLAKATIG